jgi:Protein of unknown function (DUF2937)
MLLVRGLLDRLVLVVAIVAGGLVPGFIAQYRQRLGGRLDQARLDLAGWQKIADQLFHGDLNQLIHYHAASSDPAFHSEALAIQQLVTNVQHLEQALAALHGDLLQQARYLALHLDPSLARATVADWTPTFSLSLEGLVFAIVFALAVWLLFHALWWSVTRLFRGPAQTRALPAGARR